MSVETGLAAAVVKWWGVIFVPIFAYIWKKMDNTYSKEETEQQIELRLIPIQREMNRGTELMGDLADNIKANTEVVQDIRVHLVKHIAETTDPNAK